MSFPIFDDCNVRMRFWSITSLWRFVVDMNLIRSSNFFVYFDLLCIAAFGWRASVACFLFVSSACQKQTKRLMFEFGFHAHGRKALY